MRSIQTAFAYKLFASYLSSIKQINNAETEKKNAETEKNDDIFLPSMTLK